MAVDMPGALVPERKRRKPDIINFMRPRQARSLNVIVTGRIFNDSWLPIYDYRVCGAGDFQEIYCENITSLRAVSSCIRGAAPRYRLHEGLGGSSSISPEVIGY